MTRAKAKQLRQLIEQLAVTLDDETALTCVELFPTWVDGKAYASNDRVQPTGAHDAYKKGDKVTFEGKHYISLIDGNVYSPAAYPAGWQEQA